MILVGKSKNISIVIMAAGEGTRMKSKLPKMLQKVCGKPVIDYVLDASRELTENQPIVIVGYQSEKLKEHLGDSVKYALQNERKGTGHAVMMAEPYLKEEDGYVVVLACDTPLITGDTLKNMVEYTVSGGYQVTALSAVVDDPSGYGRIIRSSQGEFECIVEHKDAKPHQLDVNEVNASMYCFQTSYLLDALKQLKNDNAQGEYYLTDALEILKNNGHRVGVYVLGDYRQMLGINTRVQLAEADKIMRERINEEHMLSGVTIIDPSSTYIQPGVKIGSDTVIYPGNVLEGDTVIGEGCTLYPNNRIVNSKICDNVELQASIIVDSTVGENTTVGPYAYLRPGSNIGSGVRIGDFVEIKNSKIGDGTKVSHLTYIGDADFGRNINVGCGTVCVNYDGKQKHRTTVGDNSFIGCNVNLIAPVEVEDHAYVAAGSTITEKVPSKALAIARARQVNKEGWVDKKKKM